MKLNTFAKIALALFVVFCMVSVVKLKMEFNALEEKKLALEESISATQRRNAELSNKLETPFDDEYVAEIAKNKLNLVMPDEVIFYNDLAD